MFSPIRPNSASGMGKMIKCTIFPADINDFQVVDEVYADFFSKPNPARGCFAVAALPLDAKVEIEAVAAVG